MLVYIQTIVNIKSVKNIDRIINALEVYILGYNNIHVKVNFSIYNFIYLVKM